MPIIDFPPVNKSTSDGLLAVGGDLTPARLILAYASGIFPWYNEEPILWFSPHPRLVLYPLKFHCSKKLKQLEKKGIYRCEFDTHFEQVIEHCAKVPREGQDGTWIHQDMKKAYRRLFHIGIAHCVAVFNAENQLCGGLYGLSLGRCFFGESMFHLEPNTSKLAMKFLCEHLVSWNFDLIDCQMTTSHLLSLGAEEIDRSEFIKMLSLSIQSTTRNFNWG